MVSTISLQPMSVSWIQEVYVQFSFKLCESVNNSGIFYNLSHQTSFKEQNSSITQYNFINLKELLAVNWWLLLLTESLVEIL